MSARLERWLEQETQAQADAVYIQRQRDEALLAQVREIIAAFDADRQRWAAAHGKKPCCVHLSPVFYPSGHWCACECHGEASS